METQVSDRINCGVYVFTPDIFTAIRDVSSQTKDTGNSGNKDLTTKCVFSSKSLSCISSALCWFVVATLRRVSSVEALQPATRFVHCLFGH